MFPLYYLPITIDNFGSIPVLACMLFMYPCLWLNYYIQKKQKQKKTKDSVLSRVRLMLATGWKDTTDPDLKTYQQRKAELSLHDGCVLWGTRVVIPPPGRERILNELHEGHPSISKMKSLARCFVWWPGLDNALEQKV